MTISLVDFGRSESLHVVQGGYRLVEKCLQVEDQNRIYMENITPEGKLEEFTYRMQNTLE